MTSTIAHVLCTLIMTESRNPGTLYVVATPIGNLDDITARAANVLRSVQIVAAEDTRRTRVLLGHLDAHPGTLTALHDFNEDAASRRILDQLERGRDVALVSDAGTPLLSDPGFELVRAAFQRDIRVVPIPGPSAITATLSASPIPVDRFRFEGFLATKAGARQRQLRGIAASDVAVVCFESPRRVSGTLEALEAVLGDNRHMVLAKELTKLHEQIVVGTAKEVREWLDADSARSRGEFVLLIAPADPDEHALDVQARRLLEVLCEELAPSQAARIAAKVTGAPKRTLYDYAKSLNPGGA
jgi:16S rRNA (cytidine1402-2'-O)-methyltransferase